MLEGSRLAELWSQTWCKSAPLIQELEIRRTIITCKKNRTKFFHQGLSSSSSGALLFQFSFFVFHHHPCNIGGPTPQQAWGWDMGLTEKCSPPPSTCCLVMGGGGDWKKLCVSEGKGFAKAKAKGFPPLLEVSRPCGPVFN
jgi:hypothetical protein